MCITVGLIGYAATVSPQALYNAVARIFDRDQASDERPYRSHYILDVRNPLLSPIAWQGRALYKQWCSSCHGNTTGGTRRGPPLVIYDIENYDNASFLAAIRDGVKQQHWSFGDMPPISAVSGEQARKIIAYVRETQIADQRRQRRFDQ